MYSVLSPEGFSSILWKDASRAKEAAEVMKLTPENLMELSVIDKILPESENEIDLSNEEILLTMKKEFTDFLKKMAPKTSEELIQERYEKFRAF